MYKTVHAKHDQIEKRAIVEIAISDDGRMLSTGGKDMRFFVYELCERDDGSTDVKVRWSHSNKMGRIYTMDWRPRLAPVGAAGHYRTKKQQTKVIVGISIINNNKHQHQLLLILLLLLLLLILLLLRALLRALLLQRPLLLLWNLFTWPNIGVAPDF